MPVRPVLSRVRPAVAPTVLLLVPLALGALWLVSGRETLTKRTRYQTVRVTDPVFGDVIEQTQALRGPVAGYFVGLDAVAGSAAACAAAWAVGRWLARRARRAAEDRG